MKIMIIKTKAHLSPGDALKAAEELREMVKTGIIVLDGRFEFPPAIFESEAEPLLSVCNRNCCELKHENEFLMNNRDKLRAAIQHGLDENNRLKKEYADLDERASRYFREKEDLLLRERDRQARTLLKVERALGFPLFDWQKEYIFEGKPYGAEICFARCAGKTLAHCLRLCLSDGEEIHVGRISAKMGDKEELRRFAGEDGVTHPRLDCFIHDLRKTYTALREAGGIELREIVF